MHQLVSIEVTDWYRLISQSLLPNIMIGGWPQNTRSEHPFSDLFFLPQSAGSAWTSQMSSVEPSGGYTGWPQPCWLCCRTRSWQECCPPLKKDNRYDGCFCIPIKGASLNKIVIQRCVVCVSFNPQTKDQNWLSHGGVPDVSSFSCCCKVIEALQVRKTLAVKPSISSWRCLFRTEVWGEPKAPCQKKQKQHNNLGKVN